MNSNTPNPNDNTFRQTFGIVDPKTGRTYEDVIGATLQNRMISLSHLERGFLTLGDNKYAIHVDNETLRSIIRNVETYCVISFQRRTYGYYALVRLYKPSLVKTISTNKEPV